MFPPGTRIGGYEIVALLGSGGMGEVYRARDPKLQRDVAIKILPDSFAADPDRLMRFEREAQALAALNHPHIAQIYGVVDDRALVMELVDGEDLSTRIARGPISIDEALPIARQIAEAFEAAHERGIIHRDLKPANVKVKSDGAVKILDFGLAKAIAHDRGPSASSDLLNSPTIASPAMTMNGMILGTAAYMSPEQAKGKPVDKRADIWAFGCVLYEMLTGRALFAGDSVAETIGLVVTCNPDWTALPPETPTEIRRVLQRCLQKDPRQRIRDIGDIRLELDTHDERDPVVVRATAEGLDAPVTWRRPWIVAALVVFAFAAGTFFDWPNESGPLPAPSTRFEFVLPPDQQLPVVGGLPLVALSPDGRSIAYISTKGLYLRTLADLEPRLVPGTERATLGTPFFSPDGQWLGWSSGTEVLKVPIAGGEPISLVKTQPFGASWPEPDTILFADRSGLFRLPANGGVPQRLIGAADGEQFYGPRLLPNGAVLFSVATGQSVDRWEKSQVVIAAPATGQRTVVATGTEARYFVDGIVTYTAGQRLFAVRFDLEQHAVIGAPVPIVDHVQVPVGLASMVATGANYDVSSTGALIYLPSDTAARSLVWINRDGTIAGPVAGIPPGSYEDPRLSPDGKRVAVTRDGDIWTYEIESGRESRLTGNGASMFAAWSPSGTEIAYASKSGDTLQAWVAPADGSGEPRQVTDDGQVLHIDGWSPDGRTLSVHEHLPKSLIRMIALDGTAQPTQAWHRESQAEGAIFARDGRHVVYLSNDSGRREIYIRPYPGGARTTVSVDGGREATWAANGEVFYRSLDGTAMFAVRPMTSSIVTVSKPQLLFHGSYYVAPTGSPRPQYDVTRDGQRFLMLSPSALAGGAPGRPRIVVVQNWLSELKHLLGRRPQ